MSLKTNVHCGVFRVFTPPANGFSNSVMLLNRPKPSTSSNYSYWTDGQDLYFYDSDSKVHYKYDKTTNTWLTQSWNVAIENPAYIWMHNGNTYYSNGTLQYVYNADTGNWDNKIWNGLTDFSGASIWTHSGIIYYKYTGDDAYVLDASTDTWLIKTWNGGWNDVYFGYMSMFWGDGDNVYFSYRSQQYVLDISTSTWKEMRWQGITSFDADYVYSDGINIYYQQSSSSARYILDKEKHMWIPTAQWSTAIYTNYLYSDGTYIYGDYNGRFYVLMPKDACIYNKIGSGYSSWQQSYAIGKSVIPNGTTTVETNGSYELSEFKTIKVAVPEAYVFKSTDDLPETAVEGSIAMVAEVYNV